MPQPSPLLQVLASRLAPDISPSLLPAPAMRPPAAPAAPALAIGPRLPQKTMAAPFASSSSPLLRCSSVSCVRCSWAPPPLVPLRRPGDGSLGFGFVSSPNRRSSLDSSAASLSSTPCSRGASFSSAEEDNKGYPSSTKEDEFDAESKRKASQLRKRIVFGLGVGVSAGGVVLAGGWIFTVAFAAAVFIGAREYFELVRSRGITAGMTPPPRYVSRVCSVICTLMPILTWYFGHIDVSVTSAAFFVAIALLLQRGNPRFSQLSSTMFGLFYVGYLPCFWVMLRGLATPALNTRVGAGWPILLGGPVHWTVGLVATLIAISSIIAADTFAFLGGKAFGKTPLTSISPKKTWEGTIVGLGGCIATSVMLSRIFNWPTSLLSAISLGFLTFFGSVFGDLTESMIKRDAGVKDSGSLIPGHGGILDRVDSYIFTGALVYSFVKTILPLYGV